ncbi:MAG: hypothetical protein MRY32_04505 [Rickettsiales bacterium]|nr:hypothetical protein [Rickettsiales bacterium]
MDEMTEEKTRLELQKERYERALELSEEKDELPAIATEDYHGPSEAVTAMVRGSILGAVGYFGGRAFGNALYPGAARASGGHDLTRKLFRYTGAGILGVMGVHSGSKQVRDTRSQTRRMQTTITKMYKKNEALKEELKAQLKGQGRLNASDVDAVEENQMNKVVEEVAEEVQVPLPDEKQVVEATEAAEAVDADEITDLNEDMAEAMADQDGTDKSEAAGQADDGLVDDEVAQPEEQGLDEQGLDEPEPEEQESIDVADLEEEERGFDHDDEEQRKSAKGSGKKDPQIAKDNDAELGDDPETQISMQGMQHEVVGQHEQQLGA